MIGNMKYKRTMKKSMEAKLNCNDLLINDTDDGEETEDEALPKLN